MTRSTPAPAKAPRTVKTPEQRAEEALDVARRAASKANDRLLATTAARAAAVEDQAKTRARLEYLAGNPDLPATARDEALSWLAETALDEAPVDVQPV